LRKNFYIFATAVFFILKTTTVFAQAPSTDEDAFFIKNIYSYSLTQGNAYTWLRDLCARAPGRVSGSAEAAAAVEFTRQIMDTLGLDTVYLQPCMVPHWVRGAKEQCKVVGSPTQGDMPLNVLALGNSVATPEGGLTAPIIMVMSLEEVEKLGEKVRGKIVFFNRPMDGTQVSTFSAYGGAVDQRVKGPAVAAKYGAIAVIVRSVSSTKDDFPHTGVTVYDDKTPKIPAVAVSTNDADKLTLLLKAEKEVRLFIKTNCKTLAPVQSYNVIGEIRGKKQPQEIILVGGHLDAWDVGKGAHDDGAGCVHSMQVLHTLHNLGYKPNRTLRCVLFMNEENGLAGGTEYARLSNLRNEYHLAAIESDAGGFTPRGFQTEAESSVFIDKMKKITRWSPLLEAYDLTISKGGSGADISPLKSQLGLLIGFRPDSQRYFDIHHTAEDTIDKVNPRELHLGAAAITSLLFLIDKYGL
jgi:hypothetical protein